ncbi:unnamed protein product [marine sediment metagenome]|uniref:Uncharacterized protein n=1 Tax=marine sediment metagenome TaxID=412755 RepID=X0YCX1_9ZZZZ
MSNIWEVKEGTRYVLPTEKKAFSITTTPVGSSPSDISVLVYDELDDSDVTSTVYPTNDPGADGTDVIELSLFRGDKATEGHKYRVHVTFDVDSGDTWTRVFKVTVPEL